jgi:ribosomal protein S18 acetylase RimI-like enzyme
MQLIPPVAMYLEWHERIGQKHLWWMMRAKTRPQIKHHLEDHNTTVFSAPCGYFEIAGKPGNGAHLRYFGLFPEYRGRGLGPKLLNEAILQIGPKRAISLTTSSADHPAALPMYLKAGFVEVGSEMQSWPIPRRLKMPVA